jgi:hypothetical protein
MPPRLPAGRLRGRKAMAAICFDSDRRYSLQNNDPGGITCLYFLVAFFSTAVMIPEGSHVYSMKVIYVLNDPEGVVFFDF